MRSVRHAASCASLIAYAIAMLPMHAAASVHIAHEFSQQAIPAHAPIGAIGWNSGVALTPGAFVRVTASGTITLANGPCGRTLGPQGCALPGSTVAASHLVKGELAAAFVGSDGQALSGWQPVGTGATLQTPFHAVKILLKVWEMNAPLASGAYEAATDVLPLDPVQRGALNDAEHRVSTARYLQSTRYGTDPSAGYAPIAGSSTSPRQDVQHLLRRFGWSATPEQVTAVVNAGGPLPWLNQQIAPSAIDDSALTPSQTPLPINTNNQYSGTGIPPGDMGFYTTAADAQNIFESRRLQAAVSSKKQLQEKIYFHWLEHFAVDYTKVFSIDYQYRSTMEHYNQVLHDNALGNFKTIVIAAAKEQAVQYWLDELSSIGTDPANPPNENLGRELMQLYTIGNYKLNPDGTQVLDSTGQPIPNYTEADVKQAALLLTGYVINYTQPTLNAPGYPSYVRGVSWNPNLHPTTRSYTIMGQTINDPGGQQCTVDVVTGSSGPCVYDNFITMLANNPVTWAYESKELIERFATETPSPAFVARISAVWGANVNAPNQIGLVVKAIALDPEFQASKHSMVKEPIEALVDAVRVLHGDGANLVRTNAQVPLTDLLGMLNGIQQEPLHPGTVFSFYRPGNKEAMYSTSKILGLWSNYSRLTSNEGVMTDQICDSCSINMDLTMFKNSTNGEAMTDYLLDALVDGGNPQLHTAVKTYIGNNYKNLPGAVWIILTSPEYGVN